MKSQDQGVRETQDQIVSVRTQDQGCADSKMGCARIGPPLKKKEFLFPPPKLIFPPPGCLDPPTTSMDALATPLSANTPATVKVGDDTQYFSHFYSRKVHDLNFHNNHIFIMNHQFSLI